MQRVVAILESVSDGVEAMTPARVAVETGLSVSTVSRIMRELATEEMLDRFADGTYVLGTRVFKLVDDGRSARTTAIHHILNDLRDLTGETASLNVRRGDKRVCVASATSRHQLRRVIPVGDAENLVGTVPGDIFMVPLSDGERDALVSTFLSGRERSIQLERIQFAADHGYSAYADFGLTGIAVPVFGASGSPAALAVSGPDSRLTVETAVSWLSDLQAASKRIAPWIDPE